VSPGASREPDLRNPDGIVAVAPNPAGATSYSSWAEVGATLVLTKTEALFEHERQARRRDEDDLAWLDKVWSPSQPTRPGRR
jgi:hypothetical protein